MFSQAPKIKIDKNQDVLPSKMGAFCSFILFIAVLSYAAYKTNIMIAKKDVDIVQALLEDHFEPGFTFNAELGLNLALAVVNIFD